MYEITIEVDEEEHRIDVTDDEWTYICVEDPIGGWQVDVETDGGYGTEGVASTREEAILFALDRLGVTDGDVELTPITV